MQQKSMVHNNLSSPPAVETLVPFDIGVNLKKNEREAKNRVKLPYMENQNEKGWFFPISSYCIIFTCFIIGLVELKIVSNKKVRAGGQIIYVSEKGFPEIFIKKYKICWYILKKMTLMRTIQMMT
jgi:hypothetical protein